MRTLTRKHAALAIGVSLRTIDRLLASGDLPRVRVRRRVLLLEDDLATLINIKRERRTLPGAALKEAGDHDADIPSQS